MTKTLPIDNEIRIGTKIRCDYEGYGLGEVIKLLPLETTVGTIDKFMLVQFKERKFSTMCDYKVMTTVHDNISRKLFKV